MDDKGVEYVEKETETKMGVKDKLNESSIPGCT